MVLFLCVVIIGIIIFVKKYEIPNVYEDIKISLDDILAKHNQGSLKSKLLKLIVVFFIFC